MMVVAPLKQTISFAAQSTPSVQDCIDNPKLCDDNSKKKTQQEPVALKSTNFTFFDYIKMIFSFIIVIGLLYLVLYWIKRNGNSFTKNSLIQSLGGSSLGSNKSVQIVKIGNSVYVVGVGENVTLLKEIKDANEIQTIEEIAEQKSQTEIKVSKWFENAIKKDSVNQTSTKETFQNLLNSQIQTLKDKKNTMLTRIDKKGIDKDE
jgi:flagellar protein FliO/FliZ